MLAILPTASTGACFGCPTNVPHNAPTYRVRVVYELRLA